MKNVDEKIQKELEENFIKVKKIVDILNEYGNFCLKDSYKTLGFTKDDISVSFNYINIQYNYIKISLEEDYRYTFEHLSIFAFKELFLDDKKLKLEDLEFKILCFQIILFNLKENKHPKEQEVLKQLNKKNFQVFFKLISQGFGLGFLGFVALVILNNITSSLNNFFEFFFTILKGFFTFSVNFDINIFKLSSLSNVLNDFTQIFESEHDTNYFHLILDKDNHIVKQLSSPDELNDLFSTNESKKKSFKKKKKKNIKKEYNKAEYNKTGIKSEMNEYKEFNTKKEEEKMAQDNDEKKEIKTELNQNILSTNNEFNIIEHKKEEEIQQNKNEGKELKGEERKEGKVKIEKEDKNNKYLEEINKLIGRIKLLEEDAKIRNNKIEKLEEDAKIKNNKIEKLEEDAEIKNNKIEKLEEDAEIMKKSNRKRRDIIIENQLKIAKIENDLDIIKSRNAIKAFIDYCYKGMNLTMSNSYESKIKCIISKISHLKNNTLYDTNSIELLIQILKTILIRLKDGNKMAHLLDKYTPILEQIIKMIDDNKNDYTPIKKRLEEIGTSKILKKIILNREENYNDRSKMEKEEKIIFDEIEYLPKSLQKFKSK